MLSTSRAGWQRCASNAACMSNGRPRVTIFWTTRRTNATSQATKADDQEQVALDDSGSPSLPNRRTESNPRRVSSSTPQDHSLSDALSSHRTAESQSYRPNYTNWKKTAPLIPMHEPLPNISPEAQLKTSLRALLREVAQPVAVVTSFMPTKQTQESPDATLHLDPGAIPEHHRFHGATLSSFSSIAMDPYPLVAFALRVPSRMATALSSLVPVVPPPRSSQPAEPTPSVIDDRPAHLVINILSFSQHSLAHAFSRPDLHPYPFKFAGYSLSGDGLPILNNSLGALSCKVVARVKLHEIGRKDLQKTPLPVGQAASELFIAEVTRVEAVGVNKNRVRQLEENGNKPDPKNEPLIYWRRGYTHARPPRHHY